MDAMQSLLTLLAHAERERDTALAEMRRRQIDARNAQTQAEQLQTYRREYEQRWSSEFSRSGGIAIVQCYQGFITRLGEAIDQQTRIALTATQRLEHAERIWRESELRVASVSKLIGRRNVALRALEGRREQKLLDEQATRIAWERRGDRLAPA